MISQRPQFRVSRGWVAAAGAALAIECGADSATAPGGGNSTPAPPVAISATAGANQSADVGSPFTQSLLVKVTDASGRGVASVAVTFTVSAGAASLSTTSALTDAQGQASTSVTAGQTAGTVTITAQAAGVTTPATFSLTVKALVPAAIAATSGANQQADVGTAFAQPLVAKVTDASGRAVRGVSVTFTVSTGSATLSAAAATTDDQGLASTSVTAGASTGTIVVTAQAAGVSASATFSLTARKSALAGTWSGTTSEGFTIFYRVNAVGIVDSVNTKVSWSVPGGTCTLTLATAATASISANAFTTSTTSLRFAHIKGLVG